MKLSRKKRDETSATITQTLWLVLACSGLFALTAYASDPSWWSSTGTGSQSAVVAQQVITNSDTGVVTTNYVPNRYAVVTQGQLKQFTARAVDELNAYLPCGAGTNLNSMVSNWASDYATNGYNASNIKPSDYTAMNVGQLKYIGNKVWSQLVSGGYTNSVPTWLAQNTNTDNVLANIGQLKTVFNFDPSDINGVSYTDWEAQYFILVGSDPQTMDTSTGLTYWQDYNYGVLPYSGALDSNGLPYTWELQYFGQIGYTYTTDSSTGLTYLEDYTYGVIPNSSPTDPSNGISYAWEIQYHGQIGLNPGTTDTSTELTYWQEYHYVVPPGSGLIDPSYGILPYAWEIQYFSAIGLDPNTMDTFTGVTYENEYFLGVIPHSGLIDPSNGIPYALEIRDFDMIGINPNTYDSTTGLTYGEDYKYGLIPNWFGSAPPDINGFPYTWEVQYFGQLGINPNTVDSTGLSYWLDYTYGVTPFTGPMDSNEIPYTWEIQYFGNIGISASTTDSTGLTYLQDYTYGVAPFTGPTDSNGFPYAWEVEYYGQIGLTPSATDADTGLTYQQDYNFGLNPGSGPMDSNGFFYVWEVQYYGQIGLIPSATDPSTGVTYQQDNNYGLTPASGTMDSNDISYAWEAQYFIPLGSDPQTTDSSTGLTYLQEYTNSVPPGSGATDGNGISYAWEIQYFPAIGIDPNADPYGYGYPNIYESTHGTDPATANSVPPTPDFVVDPSGNSSGNYQTIQSAINALTSDYQIIAVKPGTYQENLSSSQFKVMLRSINGAASTIIDAQQISSGIVLGKDSIIDDFTIINSNGPAVDVEPGQDSSATKVSMVNCVLYNNQSSGGILYANGCDLTVTNCTLLNNSSGSYAVETGNDGTATLVNTILWDSGNEIGTDGVSATYSDIEGSSVPNDQGNINANPLFWIGNDGHITAESPCIDAGTSLGAPHRDMDNEPRPDANGGYDIGAEQYTDSDGPDSDGQSLPDWWQMKYFGHLGNDPTSKPDGNGFTLIQDYQGGADPTNYYSQPGISGPVIITPTLAIVSGDNQTSVPGSFASQPLVVQVKDASGQLLANAPVTFWAPAGGALATSPNSPSTLAPLTTSTDANGLAQIYFQSPLVANSTDTLSAVAGGSTSVSFNGTTGPPPPIPPSPTGLTASLDGSGYMYLSWTASSGATSYQIDRETLATGVWAIAYATSTTASYSDTAYGSGGYHYRVSAINFGGTSSPSTEYPLSRFAVIDLGVNNIPTSLNNNGDVVGNNGGQAFLWHEGTPTSLSLPAPWTYTFTYHTDMDPDDDKTDTETFSPSSTTACDISDSGAIVGTQYQYYYPIDSWSGGVELRVPVYWASGSTATALLSDPDTQSSSFGWWGPGISPGWASSIFYATQISNNNSIAGWKNCLPYALGGNLESNGVGCYWSSTSGVASFYPSVTQGSSTYVLCMNRNGDMAVWDMGAWTIISMIGPDGTPLIGSDGKAITLPSSLGDIFMAADMTAFTDTAPFIFVGADTTSNTGQLVSGAFIYDSGTLINIGNDIPLSISTPSDPTKVQVIGYNSNSNSPILMGKTGPPSNGQPTWNTNPLNINDLLPPISGWQINSVAKINNNGAIVGTATYSGTNTAIAAGSHGVMLTPVSPSTDTIYMFSGHDSDQVNLTTANFPGWTYQWKLKDSGSGTARGSFENYGTTAWSSTGTTATVTFRPGVTGTGTVAGDTRAQSPGNNTIQLWANGTLIWEKKLQVLQILPRSSWGALAATTSTWTGMAGINQFTVHHSSKEAFGIAEIQRIQKEHMGLLNGTTLWYTAHPHEDWGDIGYHFILDPSNDSDPDTVLLYEGRQLEGLGLTGGQYTVPVAVKGKNTLSGIDICILGNYQSGTWAGWMLGRENFSETRRKKLEMLLTAFSFRYQTPATLTATYPPPPVTSPPISWHQQLATQAPVVETTECPGNTTISTMPTTQTNVIYDLK